ncbi:2-polyprenyl-6-methoxyphenol hydroxylase-like FAD-dependent oxidoreductase [Nocardia sp. GAS34]|uniref:FAD-dependent monooxygenase n=1 Tax=unclassified Nocardia TaxID=2637762 RepID=UPI003D23ABA6
MNAAHTIPTSTDVLVVGGGPTGLMLAGDLARAGVAVTLIEKHSEGSELTRAFAVHARTLEELDARGLADGLIELGAKVQDFQFFGGSVKLHLDRYVDGRFPYLLITPQTNVEKALRARALELGATIVPGAELLSLSQDADGVDAVVKFEDAEHTIRAAYLAGADGYRSRVREQIGVPFPGQAVIESIMLADVRLETAPADVLAVNGIGDCFAFVAPFGDGYYRIFSWNRANPQPDSAPVDFEEVREVTRRALGTDFGMHDPRWMSRFHSDERQAPTYRVGRVFLAGDAAHVHSPAGGQGMNTGIQDAANLAWKLAAVVQGWGTDALLDSYQAERHPVGKAVLRSSGAIVRAALVRPAAGRIARNVVGGAVLGIPAVGGKVARTISGIGFSYDRPQGAHELVGTRVHDMALVGEPARLYEALRGGTFVLVVPEGTEIPSTDRVTVVHAADPKQPVLLVRPDAYVAWAADNADATAIAAAMGQWLGVAATTE